MLKKIRLRTIFIFLIAGLSGALLLHTSQNVHNTEGELARIVADVTREKESIRLLRTEWAYLNSPPRLEKLANQYLGLFPSDPALIKTDGNAIPSKLPVPLPETEARPVSYVPAPPVKPASNRAFPALKSPVPRPPEEKKFNDLLNDVAEGKEWFS